MQQSWLHLDRGDEGEHQVCQYVAQIMLCSVVGSTCEHLRLVPSAVLFMLVLRDQQAALTMDIWRECTWASRYKRGHNYSWSQQAFWNFISNLSEKVMAPHSSALAWKIPWMEEAGRLQYMGLWRVGHNWVTPLSLFTFMHWRRKWHPTPVFLPRESCGQRSLVGCHLWGFTESNKTEASSKQFVPWPGFSWKQRLRQHPLGRKFAC